MGRYTSRMPSSHDDYPSLRFYDHPLIQQKLTTVRDRNTSHADFRRLLNEIAALMTFGASRHLAVETVKVESPMEPTTGVRLAQPVTLVPILRAGLGMTEGILDLIPEARVAHVGVYRDEESLHPVSYYSKFPDDIADGHVFVVDPMLATGGSASFAISELKDQGCRDITMICLVAAPAGVERLYRDHPEVAVHTASLDRELSGVGYILPGLGDAGDRIFGTQ